MQVALGSRRPACIRKPPVGIDGISKQNVVASPAIDSVTTNWPWVIGELIRRAVIKSLCEVRRRVNDFYAASLPLVGKRFGVILAVFIKLCRYRCGATSLCIVKVLEHFLVDVAPKPNGIYLNACINKALVLCDGFSEFGL